MSISSSVDLIFTVRTFDIVLEWLESYSAMSQTAMTMSDLVCVPAAGSGRGAAARKRETMLRPLR